MTRATRWLSFLSAVPTIVAASSQSIPYPGDAFTQEFFDWSTITPSPKLEYHPCYEVFQCARLSVPLDWLDESNNHTATIAITKLPAKVPNDDPSFGGSLFINPGGPGGSGVFAVVASGAVIQNIVDGDKHYEIIGWDPRGVLFSTPVADCYGHDPFVIETYKVQQIAYGSLRDTDSLRKRFAQTLGWGQMCDAGVDEASILPYLSTASVARDMVAMIDRIQDLRKEEAEERRLAAGDGSQKTIQDEEVEDNEVARINYWGFSYGSFLGNTFASMFPGRVGRMIVDGICDAEDFVEGGWLKNLQDTEKIIDYFYERCLEVRERCALFRSSDNSPDDIRARLQSLVEDLKENPVPFVYEGRTIVVTHNDVLDAFRVPVYAPAVTFEFFAHTINDALAGDFTRLALRTNVPRVNNMCKGEGEYFPVTDPVDAQHAIVCSDADNANNNLTIPDVESYVAALTEQSPHMGPFWGSIRLACAGWHAESNERFTGPFTTPEHDANIVEGKPAAPLLFLTTRLDPVTPAVNAFKMSESHPGSTVLVQNSAGHCTLSAISKCTWKHIRAYINHGLMPEKGTVCEAECEAWGDCAASAEAEVFGRMLQESHQNYPLGFLV